MGEPTLSKPRAFSFVHPQIVFHCDQVVPFPVLLLGIEQSLRQVMGEIVVLAK
jgi:hypothetical protein